MSEPEPLVDVEDVLDGLEIEITEDFERRIVEAAISDLSDDARWYGSNAWASPEVAPRQVARRIRGAVRRWLRNPDGYQTSRSGSESVGEHQIPPSEAVKRGEAHFTDAEIEELRDIARGGPIGFHSLDTYAWSTKRSNTDGYVQVGSSPTRVAYWKDDPW